MDMPEQITQQPAGQTEPADQSDQQQAPAQDGMSAPQGLQIYQRLAMAARKIIFDKDGEKGLVNIMQQAGGSPAGVAHAAMMVIGQLKKQIHGLDAGVVNMVAPVVVAELCALGKAAGVIDPTPDFVKQAVEYVKQGGDPANAGTQAPGDQEGTQEDQQSAPASGLIGSPDAAPVQ